MWEINSKFNVIWNIFLQWIPLQLTCEVKQSVRRWGKRDKIPSQTTTASNRALICSASTRKILMKTSQLCFESVRDTEVFLEFEWYFFEVPPKLCQTATSLWNNCANNSSQEILRVSYPQISGGSSEKNLRQFHLLSHALGEVSHSIILFFSWWRCRCIMTTSKRYLWTPICNTWTLPFLNFLEILLFCRTFIKFSLFENASIFKNRFSTWNHSIQKGASSYLQQFQYIFQSFSS